MEGGHGLERFAVTCHVFSGLDSPVLGPNHLAVSDKLLWSFSIALFFGLLDRHSGVVPVFSKLVFNGDGEVDVALGVGQRE